MKWTFFSLYSWVRLPYENIEHDLHQHSTRITYTFDSRVCDWTHANAKCDGDSFHTWCTFSWTLNVKSPTNCSVHAWVTVRPVQFIVLLWKWLNLFDSIARAHLYITTLYTECYCFIFASSSIRTIRLSWLLPSVAAKVIYEPPHSSLLCLTALRAMWIHCKYTNQSGKCTRTHTRTLPTRRRWSSRAIGDMVLYASACDVCVNYFAGDSRVNVDKCVLFWQCSIQFWSKSQYGLPVF